MQTQRKRSLKNHIVLHKEYRKHPCIKKAGIALTWNVRLKPLKVNIWLTYQNIIKIVT